ncbi:MAG: DMT family transporter [Lachnospiraceae bacterium]|jgi:drug/metabolite transporter (DMT)-like permease
MADYSETTLSRAGQVQHTLLLVLTALIWGMAFAAQSIGAEYVGAFTFLAARSWIAVIALLPVIRLTDWKKQKEGRPTGAPSTAKDRGNLRTASLLCGFFLFAASASQQIGIAYTTTAKASFITALYCVVVPVISIFLGKRPDKRIWLCVALSVAGLYLLCFQGAVRPSAGDLALLLCAVLFALQILTVDHYETSVDGIRLSEGQFLVTAVFATIAALFFEKITPETLAAALPAILYAGLFSSAVGYTLQIVAQRGLDPTIASLAMCLESVFGALSGWIFLHQTMTPREIAGAGLMFAAIVIAQFL